MHEDLHTGTGMHCTGMHCTGILYKSGNGYTNLLLKKTFPNKTAFFNTPPPFNLLPWLNLHYQ
jgi:hypothetical protein